MATYRSLSKSLGHLSVLLALGLTASCGSNTSNEKVDAGQRKYCNVTGVDSGCDASAGDRGIIDSHGNEPESASGSNDGPVPDLRSSVPDSADTKAVAVEGGILEAGSDRAPLDDGPDVRSAGGSLSGTGGASGSGGAGAGGIVGAGGAKTDAAAGAAPDSSDGPAPDVSDAPVSDASDGPAPDASDAPVSDASDAPASDSSDAPAPDASDGHAAADTADVRPDGPAQTCSIANPAWAKAWPHSSLAPGSLTATLASGQGLAVAPDGNRWATGKLYASLDLGTGQALPYTTASPATSDGFLAKLDPATGLATQAFRFGDTGASDQYGAGVAIAQGGNVGVIGYYSASVLFTSKGKAKGSISGIDNLQGTSSDPGAGMWFYLVANGASSAATVPYVTPVKAASVDVGTGALLAITSNPSKGLFAVCGKTHIADLGSGTGGLSTDATVTYGGSMDIIVAVVDATTGSVVWGHQFGGVGDQTCNAVAMDSTGNVYIAGTYNGSLDFGGGRAFTSVATSGLALPYVAVLAAADGTVTQAKTWGTSGNNAINSIAVDGSSVYIGGALNASVSFGSIVPQYYGQLDALVVKLDTLLAASWGKSFGDASYDQKVSSLDVTSAGVVTIGGSFMGNLQGLGLVAPENSRNHAFSAQLSGADGSTVCAYEYGDDPGNQSVTAVTVARAASGALADSVVIGGTFKSTLALGSTTLTWPGTPTCSMDGDCTSPLVCAAGTCVSTQDNTTFISRLSP